MTDLGSRHIGGPTVLIELDGWRLLTDPTFDAPGRRYAFGWGSSSRELTVPAVSASDLPRIDAVLLTLGGSTTGGTERTTTLQPLLGLDTATFDRELAEHVHAERVTRTS